MIDFLKQLTEEFKVVSPESYHERNTAKVVEYPYLTFDFDDEYLSYNVDGFTIDVDIFDNDSSYLDIFQMEEALRDHFEHYTKLTDDLFIRFSWLRSNKIPTGDDNIKRRNIQFYCKTDWRTK